MSIIKRIIYVIVGTILVVLGGLGIYGVIGLSNEYSSEPFYLIGQSVLLIALLIIGIYLLVQFYKKPKIIEKKKDFDVDLADNIEDSSIVYHNIKKKK